MQVPVGREVEREAIFAFLAAASTGPASLTVEGDPGMGKTTLCRYAVSLARDAGFEVLEAYPTQSEADWTFAGLTDLMSHVPASQVDVLPPP